MSNRRRAVVITARGRNTFAEAQAARLERAADVRFLSAEGPIPPDELVEMLKEADVCGLTPRSVPSIDGSWVSRLPRLRGIAVFATGVDYIDTALLKARGIALSHLPEYSSDSVAEHALGMMLTMTRRIHLSQDRVRGRVPPGTSVLGFELRGKTLGIVGLGRIGSRVAELAGAFGMRVLACDPRGRGAADGVRLVGLDELLASSDIVSLHMPAQWQGPAAFGEAELARMKTGATLVNVSRCALVDPYAVVHAIEEGRLRGYAVDDLFPLADKDERAARQIAQGRLLQTGHTAWYSVEVLERGYDTWVDNLCGLATGQPQNLV
ncbi:2-hydroxyacid dehydrogenase [Cohnella sp. JJ-181]|uniref:2-hydroxyacid dehydrogenase n=1 Tax=Cohnella rhizoplanae TaxID=2974897 RepID=UPI0022FFA732|nr:2-hydroxyacid dehydrogenase [Cohnella sp. JJ-181]CAI6068659.1 Glycerate dehydrogenase [Cohnella sp. JJ-181]